MPDPASIARVVEADYDIGATPRCAVWHRGFNDYFLVETDERYLLRVYSPGKYWVSGTGDLDFELDLLAHLDASGVPVAAAITRREGGLRGEIDAPEGPRSIALFPFVEGGPPSADASTAAQVGELVARMHDAMDGFTSPHHRYSLDRSLLIDTSTAEIRDAAGDGYDEGLALLDRVGSLAADAIDALGTSPPAFGVIHADLHMGNMIASGDTITFLDFDHGGFGLRAYDLVPILRYEDMREPFLEAYRGTRSFGEEEVRAAPAMSAARTIWDWGDVLKQSDYLGGRGRYTAQAWTHLFDRLEEHEAELSASG